MKNRRKNKGFTLIEVILVTVAVIGLTVVAFSAYEKFQAASEAKKVVNLIHTSNANIQALFPKGDYRNLDMNNHELQKAIHNTTGTGTSYILNSYSIVASGMSRTRAYPRPGERAKYYNILIRNYIGLDEKVCILAASQLVESKAYLYLRIHEDIIMDMTNRRFLIPSDVKERIMTACAKKPAYITVVNS